MYYIRSGDELVKSNKGKVMGFTSVESVKRHIKENKIKDTMILKAIFGV